MRRRRAALDAATEAARLARIVTAAKYKTRGYTAPSMEDVLGVGVCNKCGALVPTMWMDAHNYWHGKYVTSV